MKIDEKNPNHIIADDGKTFVRKADGFLFGEEIYLGYAWYIGEEKLNEPKKETPEDFKEVDKEN